MEFAQNSGGKTTGKKHKYNNNGELYCFRCVSEDPWSNNCPELNKEQQGKVHAQYKNEELEEEDYDDKIVFV